MQNTKFNIKDLSLILISVFILALITNVWLIEKNQKGLNASIVNTVSAQEIYSIFECSCCGKTIDLCSCPMAEGRRTFVDGLTAAEISKDAAIMAYVKKYGSGSFADKSKQQEFREQLIAIAPTDRPIISLSPDSYDFGDISQKEGVVTTIFEIENRGKSELVINKLETSCGCTSASIIYQGEEGPKFNMPGHGINEGIGDWQIAILAGEKAQLKVYYDPDMHGDFRGTAIREISIFSNDPVDFEKKVIIELNQID